MVLVDTMFLLDVMRGREKALDMLDRLEDAAEPIAIATITLFEFQRGLVTVTLPAAEKKRIADVVRARVTYAFDAAAAERAGAVDAQLWERGEAIDPEDACIAGIALARNEELVTRRGREFGRVAGLRLRTY